MTHEPDIIREAERVVAAMPAGEWNQPPKYWNVSEEWVNSTGVPPYQRVCRFRIAYNGIRVATDEQRDYGDEDRNAR